MSRAKFPYGTWVKTLDSQDENLVGKVTSIKKNEQYEFIYTIRIDSETSVINRRYKEDQLDFFRERSTFDKHFYPILIFGLGFIYILGGITILSFVAINYPEYIICAILLAGLFAVGWLINKYIKNKKDGIF